MGLFSKSYENHRVDCARIGQNARLIVEPIDCLIRANENSRNEIRAREGLSTWDVPTHPVPDALIWLDALAAVSIGSYLNGQRLMRGRDWELFMDCIKDNLNRTGEGRLDEAIEHIVATIPDIVRQSYVAINNYFRSLGFDSQNALSDNRRYLVEHYEDVVALMLTSINLQIDAAMQPRHLRYQRAMVLEMEQLVYEKFHVSEEVTKKLRSLTPT